ncbi:MAG: amino acid adenylation domain-containing protein [Pirellulaceae bacterium]
MFANATLGQLADAVDRITGEATSTSNLPSSIGDSDSAPLSSAQQRFWLLQQLEQTEAFLHVPVSITLRGSVDADHVQAALDRLCQRHAALRTIIETVDQSLPTNDRAEIAGSRQQVDRVVQQRVLQTSRVPLQFVDLTVSSDGGSIADRLARHRDESIRRAFDLTSAPLMRATLLKIDNEHFVLDLVLHHIVCDAGSLEILLRDLFCDSDMSASGLRYIDFAAWDQSVQRSGDLRNRLDYWCSRLAGLPERLSLPNLKSNERPATEMEPIVSIVDVATELRLQRIARDAGMTTSMLYLAAMQYALSRYTGSLDLPVALPTSNRPTGQLDQTVGCFINPIIFRGRIDPEASLLEWFKTTRDQLLEDLEHSDVPFQHVVDALAIPRSATVMPLAQTMFLYQQPLAGFDREDNGQQADVAKTGEHATSGWVAFAGGSVESIRPDYSAVTAYDLSVIVHPSRETEITIVHNDRVDRETARNFLQLMQESLRVFANNPGASIIDLPSIAANDRVVVQQHAGVEGPVEASVLFVKKFAEVAKKRGDSIAVTDDHRSISYSELQTQSTRIARGLFDRGVRRGDRVGVSMSRTIDMLAVLIGVWKAGAAYVPLDRDLPDQRLLQMIDEASLKAIVVDEDDHAGVFAERGSVPNWRHADLLDNACDATSLPTIEGSDLAYILFTSGSTGHPKGVAVEHGNVANLLQSFSQRPGFSSDDSLLALTTTSFDISVLELFLPLWVGGRVRLTASSAAKEPEAIAAILHDEPISWLQTTPTAFRVLLATGWRPQAGVVRSSGEGTQPEQSKPIITAPPLRCLKLLCGGEPLPADLARQLRSTGCEVWNVYGPTETTVWSTLCRVEDDRISIGKPIDNTSLAVLDANQRPVPVGVSGELWIGGAGVARGYWNRPELTSERFMELKNESLCNGRAYRTGDQIYFDRDGSLYFLARNDRQVKLRGFRIELDEIEAVMERCDQVQRAAVLLSGEADRREIVAFLQGSTDIGAA